MLDILMFKFTLAINNHLTVKYQPSAHDMQEAGPSLKRELVEGV